MSNGIKKPNNGASEVSVARYLMQQFPEWKEQLKNLVHAYEMPFQHFCKKEAEYRLDELGILNNNRLCVLRHNFRLIYLYRKSLCFCCCSQ